MADTPRPKTNQHQPTRADLRRSRYEHRAIVHIVLARVLGRHLNIDMSAVLGPARGAASVVIARHTAMYIAVFAGRLSLTEAGRLFERDRRAVALGVARLEERRELETSFDHAIDGLLQLFRRALDETLSYYRLSGTLNGAGA